MGYSIGEISALTGLTPHTLRYYEKEGIIDVPRKKNGLREFTDMELEMLKIVVCLRETNMSINDIKNYVALCQLGKDSASERKELFILQKKHIEEQIEKLHDFLDLANYKIWYYDNVIELGNEDDPNNCENMKKLYEESKAV